MGFNPTTGTNGSLRRTTSVPNDTLFTTCGWAFYDTTSGYRNVFWMSDADDSPEIGLAMYDADFYCQGSNGNGQFSSPPGTNTWFFWAVVGDSGGHDFYYSLHSSNTFNNVSVGLSAMTPTKMFIGCDAWDQKWSGGVSHIKVWDATLTLAELEQEKWAIRPVRWANLHIWSPAWGGVSAEWARDYSGNGRAWTVNGTMTASADPPVSYGTPIWVVGYPTGGAGAYTLECDAGSYTLTGQNATLSVNRKIALDAGSYATTGQASTLSANRTLVLDAGSYATSGLDVTLSANRTLVLDAGSYATTGQATTLSANRTLVLDAGSYATTGLDATLAANRVLALDAGSYTVSGLDVTFSYSGTTYTLTLDAGSYATTGQNATLSVSRALALDAGSYATSGLDATLAANRVLALDAGAYTLSGQAATLVASRALALDAGSYATSGLDVTLTYTPTGGPTYTLALDAGAYTTTGQATVLVANRALALDAGSYAVSGQAASLIRGFTLAADAGSYTINGQAATLVASRTISLDVGGYAITGLVTSFVYSGEILHIVSADVELSTSVSGDVNLAETMTADLEL